MVGFAKYLPSLSITKNFVLLRDANSPRVSFPRDWHFFIPQGLGNLQRIPREWLVLPNIFQVYHKELCSNLNVNLPEYSSRLKSSGLVGVAV